MKAGYIHFGNLCDSKLELKIGTPQGSIISPLLCNILLHELDLFMSSYIMEHSNFDSIKRKVSAEYNASRRFTGNPWEGVYDLANKIVEKRISKPKVRAPLRPLQKMNAATKGIRYYAEDPDMNKIQYIRYANDFVIGAIGSKRYGFNLLSIVTSISASLGMNINVEKSGVVHHKKGVFFLGYRIYGDYGHNVK